MKTTVKKVSKNDVRGTLLLIPEGGVRKIKTHQIKPGSIRTAARRLNIEGYSFIVSEKGLIDEVKIERRSVRIS